MIYNILINTYLFNENRDRALDNILSTCIPFGVLLYKKESSCRSIIEFGNGTSISFWDENKYYAWLMDGTATMPDGFKYTWKGRPSAKNMYRLQKAIDRYVSSIFIEPKRIEYSAWSPKDFV